ncbi:MAG: glycine C-acetyltransferase [Bacillota bacterium]
MKKLDFLTGEVTALKEQGLYNIIRTISSPQGSWFEVDGKRVLNLCSNNYLGFANHPRLKSAAKRAVDEFGVGPGAVRTISGTQTLHLELEDRLACFKGTGATILLQAGFTANLAVIPLLVGPEDVIFSDELNHASIIDGCRLSRAKIVRYAHNDPSSLHQQLREHADVRRRLVVTDGVFSMDGDIAPLPELVKVAQEFDAITMVDDAHGEGVMGDSGRGIVDHFGLVGQVDVEVGTLSKAFGVMGGYVAGSRELIEYLKQRGRPFLFSTGLTPADTGAALEAVRILQESDEPVRRLWDNTNYFKAGLRALGFDTGQSVTPITPVMVGDARLASEFSKKLFEAGVFAQSIAFPTVPRGKARIRVMNSAVHSREDLDFALDTFRATGRELGLI